VLDVSERDVIFAIGMSCMLFVVLSISMSDTFEDARVDVLKYLCVQYANSSVPVSIEGDSREKSFVVFCVDERRREEAFNVSFFMPEVLVR
jgi:hypothetical protein